MWKKERVSMTDDRRSEAEPAPRVVERETIVTTGRGSGGGGVLAAVVLLIALVVVLFLVFGRGGLGGGRDADIKVDIRTPDVTLPQAPAPANNQ
jgi:hypothetical protein